LSDARVRTPKPVPERRDARNMPLSATEGSVLSRVDGLATEDDIALTTALSGDQVRASLARLEALGLITFDRGKPPTPSSSGTMAAVGERVSSTQLRADTLAETPLTPEEESALAEEVDLDTETRRSVLGMHRKLDSLDHYALLGVARSIDRKALKRAYFDLAARFHPDKYFRKNLGTYKHRMEAIFGRITLAHDTLNDKDKREEYDAYLVEQRRSRSIEDLMADALAEVQRAEANVEREANEAAAAAAAPNPSPAPPPLAPRTTSSSATRPVDPAIRREALARRLLAGRPPPPSRPPPAGRLSSSPAPPTPSMAPSTLSPADAMDALRRRYEERKALARAAQARKYVTNADAALAAGDAVGAANNFRVALTLTPDDPELKRRAGEMQERANSILAETYTKQGGYEEKNGQWAEAARSWVRVANARPNDARALERAANALVKANGDLQEASRLGKQACALEPTSVPSRVTLASVYLAAGMTLNARRELETAAQLAPHDGTIQAMLKRVGKSA
jgi:curved DNA-binding protein CbpA